MPGTPPDVVEPLHPSGIAEAATVLAAALADDPGFVHLFPVRPRRERELRALYRMTLSDSVQHGHAFVTRLDGAVTGAIALYPPGSYPMTPARWWRQAFRIAADRRQHARAQPGDHQVRRRHLRRGALRRLVRRGARRPARPAARRPRQAADGDRVRPHRLRVRAVLPGDHQARQRRLLHRARVRVGADAGPARAPRRRTVDLPDAPRPLSGVASSVCPHGERRLHVHLHHGRAGYARSPVSTGDSRFTRWGPNPTRRSPRARRPTARR